MANKNTTRSTVEELIKKLQEFDAKSEVVFYENENSTPMEIESIATISIKRTRDDNLYPRLKFGKSKNSIKAVVVHVTSDL